MEKNKNNNNNKRKGQIRMMTKSEFQITKGSTEKPSSRDRV